MAVALGLFLGAPCGAAVAPPVLSGIAPSIGSTAGGDVIILYGTVLTGTTGVTVGGTACTSVTVKSATEVWATTPAKAAGTYDVAITTPGGTSSLAGAFVSAGAIAITNDQNFAAWTPYNAGAPEINTADVADPWGGNTAGKMTNDAGPGLHITYSNHAGAPGSTKLAVALRNDSSAHYVLFRTEVGAYAVIKLSDGSNTHLVSCTAASVVHGAYTWITVTFTATGAEKYEIGAHDGTMGGQNSNTGAIPLYLWGARVYQ